ncbi:SH3 and cysteine-rich domain-containing protein isoform X7 [Tachypleus tridentatus]|uniref:SH3 and cysteine-rich domain-containing protein isoform X7 n=1 Tax=Tachypleus tridentatus TaxID=6853 RepID=UPI003FD500F4
MASGGEVPFRELVSPGLNQPLQDHNVLTFRLVKTVADFTQHLSTIHERHAEELQILVENFRKRNAELRRERPPYQNSLFASWEVFLQEVEVDSQVHGDIARSLGRQVGMTLLEKTFHRKIQSRKIFLHRESFETVLSKAENLLSKCHQDYSDAYRKLLTVRNHSQLAEYYDMHNAYVQQLYATNGMLEHYHCQTLPMLLEELEEVYTDLSQTISESILSAASLLSNKAREQGDHYENICSTSRAVNSEADLANFIRTLSPDKAPPPVSHHPFTLPISENESFQMDSNYILQDVLVFDQLSLPPKPESLREEIGNLESQIRQLQESLDSLQRLQQRSLDSNLYNKANELQEDISLKRFDLQVAHIHHAAVKEQQKLFEGKARDLQENGSHHQERKASTSSTGTIKNKWLKAFRSLKSGGSSNSIEKSDAADRKSLRSFGRPETNTPSTLEPGQHIFQEYTYKKVTPCDFCREILRGHVRQGLKCKMCKMNVHVDCSEKTGRCQPKPRLLRRQKSTSDIDTNVLTPELEDSPQSPVQSRRQLLTAKTVRMSSVDLPDENEKSLSSASTSPCPSPKPHRLLPTNLYVVLYNFRCRHQDELDLKAGCTVTVIDTSDPDWWQGKCLGKVGFFPSKYVTKLHPGERPLQVIHSIQLSNGESEVKLLRDQIVIQMGEEVGGMVSVRTGTGAKSLSCPLKYVQEV